MRTADDWHNEAANWGVAALIAEQCDWAKHRAAPRWRAADRCRKIAYILEDRASWRDYALEDL